MIYVIIIEALVILFLMYQVIELAKTVNKLSSWVVQLSSIPKMRPLTPAMEEIYKRIAKSLDIKDDGHTRTATEVIAIQEEIDEIVYGVKK